jgi:hypothetical protein
MGDTEALEPVPFNVTVCVVGLALSVMVRVALTAPAAVGVNVTKTEQLPPAARLVPHVLVGVRAKTVLFDWKLEKFSVAVPELVTVTV